MLPLLYFYISYLQKYHNTLENKANSVNIIMSRKSTEEKKLRRKRNQEKEILEDKIEFDILDILRNSSLETKPEVGEFLKKYIKTIRILVEHQKITIYPVTQYSISKVFVDFLDGHQIISVFSASPRQYYLYKGLEEIELNEKEMKYVIAFIEKL